MGNAQARKRVRAGDFQYIARNTAFLTNEVRNPTSSQQESFNTKRGVWCISYSGPQSLQSARLSFQSSEFGPLPPSPAMECCFSLLWVQGRDTLARGEGGGGSNSDEGADTLAHYVYYNLSMYTVHTGTTEFAQYFDYKGSSHRHMGAARYMICMVLLHRSPIPVGRRGVFSFKWFLPAFTAPTGKGGGGGSAPSGCVSKTNA
jgi:hypothetical protein